MVVEFIYFESEFIDEINAMIGFVLSVLSVADLDALKVDLIECFELIVILYVWCGVVVVVQFVFFFVLIGGLWVFIDYLYGFLIIVGF